MSRKSRKNVGLIGLGIIGSRVAAGLRAGGFQVFVWNRTPKAAPNFVGSPAEVAGLCEIIQIFVADAQALFDVIEQMSDALTSRHLVICNATVGPEATIEAARLVEARGAAFLDAPFTGSKNAAEKCELVYYLGGDDASCLRARPVLEATSRHVVRIGDIGHAATIKVVTNMIAAVSTQTLAEALAIVQKAGLDPEVLGAALEHNACRSGTLEMKLPKMIAGDYEAHFSLKHMFKDVQLGIHVANALDIEIPATTVTAGVMYGALNNGLGELDYAALYKVYEPQVKTTPPALRAAVAARLEDLERESEAQLATPTREAENKVEAPRLADVLHAPPPAPPLETGKPLVSAEPAASIAEPPVAAEAPPPPIILEPVPAAVEAPANKPGAESTAGPIEAPKPLDLKAEDAKPEPSPAVPASEEAKAAVVVEVVPEKPSEPSSMPEGPKAHEEKLLDVKREIEASSSVESAKSGANGLADEGEVTVRPLNFVRRWFVSRGS